MNPRILALTLGNFAVGTGNLILAGILPLIARDLGVTAATAGQLVTAYALTFALGAPLLAATTGALPRRLLLGLALALFAGGHLLGLLAPGFGPLLLSRIVAAVGGALYTPTASAAVVGLVPPEGRGRALALVVGGITASTVLGVPTGTFIGQQFGWRAAFGLVVVLGAVALVILLAVLPAVAIPPRVPLRDRFAPLRRPAVVAALAVTGLTMGGQFVAYTYLALFLQEITGLGGGGISAILLLNGLASIVGITLGGWGTDKVGIGPLLAASTATAALALAGLSLFGHSLAGAALATSLWGLAGWAFSPPQQYRLVGLAPAAPALVLSLNQAALNLGTAAGSAIGGSVVRGLGVAHVGWVGAVVAGLGMLLALPALLPPRRADEALPAARQG